MIAYTFDAAHWQATRFSDGTRYGVWYGSLDVETTVYETAWHWYRFVRDSFAGEARAIVQRAARLRRALRRGAARPARPRGEPSGARQPHELRVHATLGRYVHEQGQNGLLVRSARCDGVNAAVFRAERLRNARDKLFLTYRYNPARDQLVVERAQGRAWLRLIPSALE